MRTQKYRLHIPALKEFLYSMMYNASAEGLRLIPASIVRFFKKPSIARNFAKNADLDEALTVLSYLGIDWFLVIADKNVSTIQDMRKVLDKFRDNNTAGAMKDLIEAKMFVTSDKQAITMLTLSAQTIHRQSYALNMEYSRAGYHLKKWKSRLNAPGQDPDQVILENSNALAQTFLSCLLTLGKIDFLFHLRPVDLFIILYLYPKKNTFVPSEQLYHFLEGSYPRSKIGSSIKSLLLHNYLERSALSKNPEYTLSATGIRVVSGFMEAVLHANSFR